MAEENIQHASIVEETRHRYLTYALSVITARALPDVRDGLKPVQQRILYPRDSLLQMLWPECRPSGMQFHGLQGWCEAGLLLPTRH